MRRLLLSVAVGLVGLVLVMVRMAGQGVDREPGRRPALPADARDVARLRARDLAIPVEGLGAGALHDTFDDARPGHRHEAIDILAPRGTRVLAVDDGRVAKMLRSRLGGLTVYQLDPSGTYGYYYAHLDGYAPGLAEGDRLRRGTLVGFVGTTGNAPEDAPHLHFAIYRLGADDRWSDGAPVNPFEVWVPRRP